MPGWHKASEALQKAGKVQMIGVIQEQHPDRARLFMQWQQMDWPILVDALNLLSVSVVPITLFIDEFGVIREVNPSLTNADRALDEFLNASAIKENVSVGETGLDGVSKEEESAKELILWEAPQRLDEAIQLYEKAIANAQANGSLYFRLGVAYRMRYDSEYRQSADFRLAVDNWAQALDINPNQYIWRRRIQQYGPRLDKPYPFYDWVHTARDVIRKRGETPVKLVVEPSGAEFAKPGRSFQSSSDRKEESDPQGRITRDHGDFIKIDYVIVRSTGFGGPAARVHVELRPNQKKKAHWNNTVGDLEFWLAPPAGWEVNSRFLTTPNPAKQVVSSETRKVEFEVRRLSGPESGTVRIPAYALYYVCEDVDGTCLYRRQDVLIELALKK